MGKGGGEGKGQGQGAGGEDWINGICGCMNSLPNCLCGWCCHPCQLGDVAQRQGDSYALFCLLGWCVPCIPYFMLRGKVRDRYNIDGSTAEDCMCAWCCGPCVGCQMANELDDRGA